MEIRERTVDGIPVLEVVGRMVLGERTSDTLFRSKVSDLLASGRHRLVINLEQVAQLDTSGLTALVTAHLTAAKRGGALKLVNPSSRVRELLQITRLNTLLQMYDSEAQALASFDQAQTLRPAPDGAQPE
jgi:anti-sigma B factor antagonist